MKPLNFKLPDFKQRSQNNKKKSAQAAPSKNQTGTAPRPYSHAKKRKIRYDRILLVVLLFVLLIVLIVSCATRNSGKNASSKQSATGAKAATSEKLADSLKDSDSAETSEESESVPMEAASTVSVDAAQVHAGDLVVVNDQYAYTFPSDDVSIVPIYDNANEYYKTSDMVVSLDATVIGHLNDLMEAFSKATGHSDLRVIGGYRTKEDQDSRYASDSNDKDVPKGGCSDYNTGRSFSLQMPTDGGTNYYSATGDYAWLAENAPNYGFVLRFPEEKESVTNRSSRTHIFRYVGIPHAVYMTQNNLCLEEYAEAVKAYTPDTQPLSITVGDAEYAVFYVKANASGTTDVAIPSCQSYTISGNNMDGFIVTCQLSGSTAAASSQPADESTSTEETSVAE